MKQIAFLFFLLLLPCFTFARENTIPHILILGVAQDGGYPHAGCTKKCCAQAWNNPASGRYVVSFALIDPGSNKWWLFEATPDIKYQLQHFTELTHGQYKYLPDGIFITHAHIGHYTGLMQLGKEVMNTKNIPVYALPRLAGFLETNGPWSQLVKLKNIDLKVIYEDSAVELNTSIKVEAFRVPHRDEYSETAGFRIQAGNKKYVFIPDIDKWEKWNKNIIEEVKQADIAFLDATFYDSTELPGRKMAEVPHPLVVETMQLFKNGNGRIKAKIFFIHLNHTNPLLWDKDTAEAVRKKGFNIAAQWEEF